jgi:hypothetical protein
MKYIIKCSEYTVEKQSETKKKDTDASLIGITQHLKIPLVQPKYISSYPDSKIVKHHARCECGLGRVTW